MWVLFILYQKLDVFFVHFLRKKVSTSTEKPMQTFLRINTEKNQQNITNGKIFYVLLLLLHLERVFVGFRFESMKLFLFFVGFSF